MQAGHLTTPSVLFAKTADSYINGSGNLAIGDTTPNTKLDIVGDTSIRSYTPTPLSANTDDYSETTDESNLRISSTSGAVDITGFNDGQDGKIIYVTNVDTATITLKHEDVNSAADNRMILGSTATDVALAQNQVATLMYDSTSSRWRLVSVSP